MLTAFIIDHAPTVLLVGGLAIGMAFGAIVQLTNFCTMGGLSDLRTFGDRRRLLAWVLAVAVAIAGTQVLAAAGVVALDKAMYTAPLVNWAGHIVGGLIFGFGMVFAGGCPSRNAARLGGGDLRSLVVLVTTGLAAYVTIGGVLGPLRALLDTMTAVRVPAPLQTLPSLAATATGASAAPLSIAMGLAVAATLAVIALAHRAFRSSPKHLLSGLGVGLAVVAGWALTGLAFDELADRPVAPISLTFVRPAGDAVEWLARATALGLPGFGVATVFGAILGAALAALAQGRWRLSGFTDTDDTVRHLTGAALMGIGGVMALGCTVGQGITGISTLAVGSFLAVGGIVTGGWLGLAALERRLEAMI